MSLRRSRAGGQLRRRPIRAGSTSSLASLKRQLSPPERETRSHLLAKSSAKNVRQTFLADRPVSPRCKLTTSNRNCDHDRNCSLFITTNAQPLPATGAPPTLSLHALLTAAKIAFGTESLDLDDVEGMCASLMEQVGLTPISFSLPHSTPVARFRHCPTSPSSSFYTMLTSPF